MGSFTLNGKRLGLEIKRADAPRLTPSMRHALADLRLDALWVVYPGLHEYPLHERIVALPVEQLFAGARPLLANAVSR